MTFPRNKEQVLDQALEDLVLLQTTFIIAKCLRLLSWNLNLSFLKQKGRAFIFQAKHQLFQISTQRAGNPP